MAERRWWVPEVVQSSAMDCGPAALEALLLGHGISVSGGRLREACQTDVDGTSIDMLEEVAIQLGLDAEQIVIPADHVLEPKARALPALALFRLPDGASHFVVLWRQVGRWVQVMDPAAGRRWLTQEQVEQDLYTHEQEVAAEDWAEWADTDEFRDPLADRLSALGVRPSLAHQTPTGSSLAALDASTRATRVASAGQQVSPVALEPLVTALAARAQALPAAIPDSLWSARPAKGDGTEDGPQLLLRGAVLVRVLGRRAPAEELSAELRASLDQPSIAPLSALWHRTEAPTRRRTALLVAASAVAATATVVEAMLLHLLLDVEAALGPGYPPRLIGAGVVGWLTVTLVLELALAAGLQQVGRTIAVRLHADFLAKLTRLQDRYVASRLVGDMAERSHHLHRINELPQLGADIVRATTGLALTAAALAWLDPSLLPVAVLAALSAVAVPAVLHAPLSERELRARTAAGGLGRFLIDAVAGASALRAHAAGAALQRLQEARLVDWVRARRGERAITLLAEGAALALGTGWAVVFLFLHLRDGQPTGAALLVAWWALRLPSYGQALSIQVRQVVPRANAVRRVLEPLGALEAPTQLTVQPPTGAVSISLDKVSCVAMGRQLLMDVSLSIPAGEHVAIVGRSGAGKSTLLGLLLGWHRSSDGHLHVDGAELTPARLPTLRARTAWIDPTVHLKRGSLLENLRLGASGPLGPQLTGSGLDALLQTLPDGLATSLGSAGDLLVGGAAQRLRIARALGRPSAGLVLLDEAFRGLSPPLRRDLLAHARATWREATLLCVTHDLQEAATFDRVVVIEDGRLVEEGSPAELRAARGAFHEMWMAWADREAWWTRTPAWSKHRLEAP